MREAHGSHSNRGNHRISHLPVACLRGAPHPFLQSCKPETEDGPGTASPRQPCPWVRMRPHRASQRLLYVVCLGARAPLCSPARLVRSRPHRPLRAASVRVIYDDAFDSTPVVMSAARRQSQDSRPPTEHGETTPGLPERPFPTGHTGKDADTGDSCGEATLLSEGPE